MKAGYIYSMHYDDVIMTVMASQITSLTIVYSTLYSGADQRKHQSSLSLAFVSEIYQWPVNSPHKGPVMRKMFPFEEVIMIDHKSSSLKSFNYDMKWVIIVSLFHGKSVIQGSFSLVTTGTAARNETNCYGCQNSIMPARQRDPMLGIYCSGKLARQALFGSHTECVPWII